MHRLKHSFAYALLPAVFTLLFIFQCGEVPSNPFTDYSNAKIDLLPFNVPAQGFRVGDTVTYSIIVTMPQLCSSITVSANDKAIEQKINSTNQSKDTCLIKQCFSEPDTFYVTINAFLKNNDKRSLNTKLIINGIPPVITKDLRALNYVKTGVACTLSVAASGTAPLQFLWYHDNIITTQTSAEFIIPAFSSASSGVYSCIVKNNWGADTSTSAVLISGDTLHNAEYWTIDTVRDSLSEGDSISIRIGGLYNKQLSQKNTISLAGQSSANVSVTDSVFIFRAAQRDSGDYVFTLILSDSSNRVDNLSVLLKVKPRYYTVSIAADSGTITFSPQKSQYRWNDTVQVKAIPDTGFIFHQWDGDLSGTSETLSLVITKTISGFARFWPSENAQCDNVSDTRLSDAIKMYSGSSGRPKQLCPAPGVYNNGAIKINGGVRFVLQK